MFYLGVDIAKHNHVASLISDQGELIFSNFNFHNDFDGFFSLINKLHSFDKNNIIIGIESTGHYGDNFLNFFFKQMFKIAIINPIMTNHFRKSSIRDTKNDRIDSINIAKVLILNSNHIKFFNNHDLQSIALKRLNRMRDSLTKQRAKDKILLVRCIDSTFPELQYK